MQQGTFISKIQFHMRPAADFVRLAAQYECSIVLEKAVKSSAENAVADGKSIFSIAVLGILTGDELILRTDGADEEQAFNALSAFLQGGESFRQGDLVQLNTAEHFGKTGRVVATSIDTDPLDAESGMSYITIELFDPPGETVTLNEYLVSRLE